MATARRAAARRGMAEQAISARVKPIKSCGPQPSLTPGLRNAKTHDLLRDGFAHYRPLPSPSPRILAAGAGDDRHDGCSTLPTTAGPSRASVTRTVALTSIAVVLSVLMTTTPYPSRPSPTGKSNVARRGLA